MLLVAAARWAADLHAKACHDEDVARGSCSSVGPDMRGTISIDRTRVCRRRPCWPCDPVCPGRVPAWAFLRRLRRPRILRDRLIPDATWSTLLGQHPILLGLTDDEERRLRELTTLFLHEKTFSAADGIDLTDHLRAVIAVQACLPILDLGIDWYENWRTVVVVPEGSREQFSEADEAGVVGDWEDDVSGISGTDGPVVLSWEDIELRAGATATTSSSTRPRTGSIRPMRRTTGVPP